MLFFCFVFITLLSRKELQMLVLSRGKNESIIIGSDIEIIIVNINTNRVRLGITAPKSISVHRKEVYEAIQKTDNH